MKVNIGVMMHLFEHGMTTNDCAEFLCDCVEEDREWCSCSL